MSNQRDPYRSASSRPVATMAPRTKANPRMTASPSPNNTPGGPPQRRLALSGIIRRTLLSVSEREQQRSRLVNVLILVQGMLTLITAPGYIGAPTEALSVALAVAATLVYLAAFVTNRLFHRASAAAYILVVGGVIAVAAQTLTLAISSNASGAGQVSLLFTAIILEAGLLFAPEVTLLIAFTTTTLTAFALLFALSHAATLERQDAYLLIVYTLGLQLLAGLIAWLVSQFIFESALEAQRAQELQFAQARLEALAAQVGEQQRQFDAGVNVMQFTIARVISGEYSARVEQVEGELASLADSLNVLLQRLEVATHAEQLGTRVDAAALPLLENLSRLNEGITPSPSSLPIITNTPFDSVSVAVSQLQVSVTHRLGRVQHIVGEVVNALSHSQEGLNSAKEALQEAQRIAGVLIASSESALASMRRQVAYLAQMQRMLSAVLPREITQLPDDPEAFRAGARLDTHDSGDLLGLGRDLGIANSGYTGLFDAVDSPDEGSTAQGIVPMTRPLPIVDLGKTGQFAILATSDATGTPGDDPDADGTPADNTRGRPTELPAELVEVWHLLVQADTEAAQLERGLSHFARELGVESRQLRSADANIVWFRQALDAVQRNAEQLQQVAGANVLAPGIDGMPGPTSHPMIGDPGLPAVPSQPRMPQPTRPLGQTPPGVFSGSLGEPVSPPAGMGDLGTTPAPGSLRASDLIDFGTDTPYPNPSSGPLNLDRRS
ncbi:MAG: hypothetical protein ACXWQR_08085 [Ktedonobacterales bacterium]